MALTPVKIDVSLAGKNRVTLETKSYKKTYTQLPNSALYKSLYESLSVIHGALTGYQLSLTDYTFLIRADVEGRLRNIYSPNVVKKDNSLIIKWGAEEIPLVVVDEKLTTEQALPKLKLSFKTEKIDKYEKVCIVVTYTANGNLYSMPFPVKLIDYKNKDLDGDLFTAMLEGGDLEGILELVGEASEPGEGNENYKKFEGPVIKAGYLPLGKYQVLDYRKRETNYGDKYYLQVINLEENQFYAPTKQKVGEEWETVEVSIEDNSYFQVEANSKLKERLACEPVISPEEPAILHVYEKSEYNNNPVARVHLIVDRFVVNENERLDLSF